MNKSSERRLAAFRSAMIFVLLVFAPFARGQIPDTKPVPQLPPLRTSEPVKSQIDRDMASRNLVPNDSRRMQANDDIARVVPVKCKKPVGNFPWNFDKAKMSDVVDQISRLTCRNFIISSGVKPTQEVSIISRTSINVDQAWQAFLSLLESNELALVKTGEYYKIVKRNDSIRQPIPVVDKKNELPANEGMVTYLHDLQHISRDVAQSLVKSLISRLGDVVVVGDGFLVITDGASNIRRVMQILEKVDIAGAANRIHVIDLTYADAQQIQQKLTEIFDTRGGGGNDRNRMLSAAARAARIRSGEDSGGEGFSVQKMIADERTNKLIIIASDKAYERIKEMVDLLDVPSSDASAQGQVNVYYLKNGDAKKIAATLSTVTQGNQAGQRRGGSSRPSLGGPLDEGGGPFEGDIKVTADEATNALVVVANPRDYKSISQVIAKLDKERIQVYVEAAILDIGLSDQNNFGIHAYGALPNLIPGIGGIGLLANPGGVGLARGVVENFGKALSAGGNAAAASALGLTGFLNTAGFIGPSVPLAPGIALPGIGVVLEALQTFSNVDVLSTPSLLTLDNEKAEMAVGEKVPVISGASTVGLGTGSGGIGIPLQNITYQDVKLKFGITPHVNDDNVVRMEIDQNINELGQEVQLLGSTQYRIATKEAKTTVAAKDQQTVVLGGLISQVQRNRETKIPLLGDIPILGYLFKNTTKVIEKRNLVLVLTPYVIRSEDDLRRIYERKTKEREDFGKLYFGDKITRFDPHIDYDKKTGPLNRLVKEVNLEMQRVENGGPGLPGETVIKTESAEPKDNDQSLDITVPGPGDGSMPDAIPQPMDEMPNDIDDEGDLEANPPVLEQSEPTPPPPPAAEPMEPEPVGGEY